MRLTRLAHVNLSVDDVAAAEAFYSGFLGLERAPRPADAGRAGAWFRLGASELHLSLETGADNARSKRHVAFELDDLDSARAEAVTRGLSIEEGRPAPGIRRFFVRDPAGNRIELFERTSA